jgi:hypothetical protein
MVRERNHGFHRGAELTEKRVGEGGQREHPSEVNSSRTTGAASAAAFVLENATALRKKPIPIEATVAIPTIREGTRPNRSRGVWPNIAVSDSMPAICVGELRRALGDEAKTPQLIETVHGRG